MPSRVGRVGREIRCRARGIARAFLRGRLLRALIPVLLLVAASPQLPTFASSHRLIAVVHRRIPPSGTFAHARPVRNDGVRDGLQTRPTVPGIWRASALSSTVLHAIFFLRDIPSLTTHRSQHDVMSGPSYKLIRDRYEKIARTTQCDVALREGVSKARTKQAGTARPTKFFQRGET